MARHKRTPIQHAEVVVRFGQRLREVRLSRGMTQAQLGNQATVSVAYIGRLESGKAAVGLDLLDRLASALGCTIADLLVPPILPDTNAVLTEQVRRLIDDMLATADRDMLLLLAQLLARLSGSVR